MGFLYLITGFKFLFGTRIGGALATLAGGTVLAVTLADGHFTATSFFILLLTAFAAKRVFKPR